MNLSLQSVKYYVKQVCHFSAQYLIMLKDCYYVKKFGYLVYELCELAYANCYYFNARIVLSIQCHIMLKNYVIMLSMHKVFSTQSPIILEGYYIKNWNILSTKHMNFSLKPCYYVKQAVLLCYTRELFWPHHVLFR